MAHIHLPIKNFLYFFVKNVLFNLNLKIFPIQRNALQATKKAGLDTHLCLVGTGGRISCPAPDGEPARALWPN